MVLSCEHCSRLFANSIALHNHLRKCGPKPSSIVVSEGPTTLLVSTIDNSQATNEVVVPISKSDGTFHNDAVDYHAASVEDTHQQHQQDDTSSVSNCNNNDDNMEGVFPEHSSL